MTSSPISNIVKLADIRANKLRFMVMASSVLVGTYRVSYYDDYLFCWRPWVSTANGNKGSHYVMDDFGTLVPVGLLIHQRNPFYLGVKLGNQHAYFEL